MSRSFEVLRSITCNNQSGGKWLGANVAYRIQYWRRAQVSNPRRFASLSSGPPPPQSFCTERKRDGEFRLKGENTPLFLFVFLAVLKVTKLNNCCFSYRII